MPIYRVNFQSGYEMTYQAETEDVAIALAVKQRMAPTYMRYSEGLEKTCSVIRLPGGTTCYAVSKYDDEVISVVKMCEVYQGGGYSLVPADDACES